MAAARWFVRSASASAAGVRPLSTLRTTTSRVFMPSSKETPGESTPSYQLLVRAGFIRKVRCCRGPRLQAATANARRHSHTRGRAPPQSSVGVFNLLPLALRSLRKLEALVDEELAGIGAPGRGRRAGGRDQRQVNSPRCA